MPESLALRTIVNRTINKARDENGGYAERSWSPCRKNHKSLCPKT